MKRLISLIIVVFVTSFAVVLSTQAANRNQYLIDEGLVPNKNVVKKPSQAKVSNDEENGGLFRFDPYLKSYLPLDLKLVGNDGVGKGCDVNGVLNKKEKFHCMEFISPSTKEHFRIRYSGTEGMRVFTYKKSQPVLYASFTPNPEPWKGGQVNEYSKVIYQSSEAQVYAEAHGGASDTEVAVAKPAPTQTTPTEQTATVDCSKGTLFEKAQCLGKNPAIGAVINKLPSF